MSESLPASALYAGEVVHKRAWPRRHTLRYSVFSMLVDFSELEALAGKLKLLSVNRWNVFSIRFRDFGHRDGTSPELFARERARLSGVEERVARVRMLCYPRIFGYAFNPLTVYFLEDDAAAPVMMIYEVRNTFGEHHFYERVIDNNASGTLSHSADKAFYVSPFNTLEGRYRFSIRTPGKDVFTGVTLTTERGGILTAWFEGKRREINDMELARITLAYPFMTVKIILGIHWEALKLWLKGVPHTIGLRVGPTGMAGKSGLGGRARRGSYE